MLSRWITKLRLAHFYHQTRGILETPPMPVVDAPWGIVSIVTGNYTQMYLLAIKSFYARAKRGKIIVLTNRDAPVFFRKTLEHHLPGIQFSHLEEIDTGPCQRGGTWDRLIYLLNRSESEYSIQLDCDTLAFGPDVDEVVKYAENNIAFTLGNAGRPIGQMAAVAEDARGVNSNYVGIASERLFDRYPGAETLKYVRASSGFVGFARGGFLRADIETFHRNMENFLGSRWTEWGTEQCGSNFAVANSQRAAVLPYPKYANFWPGLTRGRSAFLHFIGPSRYHDGYYIERAREVISALKAPTNVSRPYTST